MKKKLTSEEKKQNAERRFIERMSAETGLSQATLYYATAFGMYGLYEKRWRKKVKAT